MIASRSVQARRRTADLSSDAGSSAAAAAATRVASHLEGLALGPAAVAAAPYVPAAVLLGAGAAFALVGVAGVLGLVAAIAVADVALRRSAPRRRIVATDRALPVLLDAVARHLRAGASLAQAITAANPPPTAPDLRGSWDRLVHLVPVVGITSALDDWVSPTVAGCDASSRVGDRTFDLTRSVRLAAAALSLAATTGGSPARAIDGVAATLRSRLAVADEIRALSSQARASAAVIVLAPVVFGILAGVTDSRARSFFATPPGLVLLLAGVALDAVGGWWMAHLCRPQAT